MARAGETLENPVTGERIVFLRTPRTPTGPFWSSSSSSPPTAASPERTSIPSRRSASMSSRAR